MGAFLIDGLSERSTDIYLSQTVAVASRGGSTRGVPSTPGAPTQRLVTCMLLQLLLHVRTPPHGPYGRRSNGENANSENQQHQG